MYKNQQEQIDAIIENLKDELEDVSKHDAYDAYAMLRYCITRLNDLKKVAEKKAIEEIIDKGELYMLKLAYRPPRDM